MIPMTERARRDAVEAEDRTMAALVRLDGFIDEATNEEVRRRQEFFSGRGARMPRVLALESVAADAVAGRLNLR
ncbi:hypothetical protein [Aeromicrobium sp. HA]|uniref:hypothetical protein n=1 Tax=Aeromicrobium sp. HA TaxID=3009077 RepID=UPI0022AEF680|nr:hypothetical protein [Aeromicrobium sp. HA]